MLHPATASKGTLVLLVLILEENYPSVPVSPENRPRESVPVSRVKGLLGLDILHYLSTI